MDVSTDNAAGLERPEAPFWLCPPGYSIIVSRSPLTALWLETQVNALAGFDPEDPVLDNGPLCAYPMPPLGDEAIDQPLARQVENLNWFGHPIFWLKGDILHAHPFPVEEDEEPRDEFDSEIYLRLALQLEVLGFYDSTTGAWHDVAKNLGVDINDPFDVARIRAWQSGEPDEQFDTFDFGEIVKFNYPIHAAAAVAADLLPYAFIASGAVGAYSLVTEIDKALDSRAASVISNYAILVSALGMSYSGFLMTEEQYARWEKRMKRITALFNRSTILPAKTASAYLLEMREVLNYIVTDNEDVVDDAVNVIKSLQKDLAGQLR